MASFDLEQTVLTELLTNLSIADTWDYAIKLQTDHQYLIGVLKSLSADNYITDEALSTTYWILSEEGIQISENGSAEFLVFNAIPTDGGISLHDLNNVVGDTLSKIGDNYIHIF